MTNVFGRQVDEGWVLTPNGIKMHYVREKENFALCGRPVLGFRYEKSGGDECEVCMKKLHAGAPVKKNHPAQQDLFRKTPT